MFNLSGTTVIGALIALVSVFLIYHTFDEQYAVTVMRYGRGPVFFPRVLLMVMLVLALAVMYEGKKEKPLPISRQQLFTVVATFALVALYIYSITAAGFLISTIVCIFLLPWLLGYRNLMVIIAITAVYPVTVWFLFNKVFKIILPNSPWFDAF